MIDRTDRLVHHRPVRRRLPVLAAALLSAAGFMHSYAWTAGDTVMLLRPAWPWAGGYALVGLLLLVAPWITQESEGAE